MPEGQLFAEEPTWRFGAVVGEEVLVGAVRASARSSSRALGDRPVIAHDAKALGHGAAQPRPRHAAGRLPARAGAPRLPVRARSARSAAWQPTRRRAAGRATRRCCQALAAWQREQLAERGLTGAACTTIELPLVAVLRDMELAGVRLNMERLAEITRPRARRDRTTLEREIWDLAGEEFMIGSPQQLGAILFEKLGLSRKRRGKTGFSTDARVLQAIRDEHEIIPKIERWRELNQLVKTYLDVLPQLADARVAHPHDVPAGGRHHRPAGLDEPEHAERPGAHRSSAARSAAASRPRPATC